MRTLVLSDLHLGCGADPGIFAGAHALAEMLANLSTRPLRVVLNGDTFDFAAQDGGGDVAYALTQDPTNARVLAALGRVVERGGELLIRGGRHDPEIGLTAVQAHVVRGLQVSARAGARVSFHPADAPTRCHVGAAHVLVRHALADDEPAEPAWAHALVNLLRRQFGVGLADLLCADPIGAALAGLAVNPTAVKHVLRELQDAARVVLALRRSRVFVQAGLSPREEEVLLAALDPDVILGADAYDDGALRRARLKLLRAGLGEASPTGAYPRDVTPDEWSTTRALARRTGAAAVIGGHTHAAAWRAADGLIACDTGAWTWLAQVPAATSSEDVWQQYLDQWQRTPRIDARLSGPPPTRLRFTAALIAADRRGARLALIEWRAGAPFSLCEHSLG